MEQANVFAKETKVASNRAFIRNHHKPNLKSFLLYGFRVNLCEDFSFSSMELTHEGVVLEMGLELSCLSF